MIISVLGAGNMGGAIASALSLKEGCTVRVFDSDRKKSESLAEGRKIEVLGSFEDLSGTDVLIIAVKPQVLPDLYTKIGMLESGLVISIAAGVPLSVLSKRLGKKDIVRFMPNIAAKAGKSVTAVACLDSTSEENRARAMEIASAFGSAFSLDESLFPAFIGISGSGIAYAFEFMHQMAMGGVKEGIPYPSALAIVRDTLISAASLQEMTGRNAIELETMVCSAKGTTIEGVKALQDNNFAKAVIEAVVQSSQKSIELENKATRENI